MKPSHRPVSTARVIAALAAAAAIVVAYAAPQAAYAAVPKTLAFEGVLTAAGGGPVADGTYDLMVSLHVAATPGPGKLLHQEGPLQVVVSGGRFAILLGADGKLAAAAAVAEFWDSGSIVAYIQVGSEPPLGPVALSSTPSALRAAVAEGLQCTGCVAAAHLAVPYAAAKTKGGPASDLDCTGCVSVAELMFDGDVDMGGNSLKAKNAAFSGDINAKTMTAQSFIGDGSKLTGIASPSGSCAKGLVVSGIAADGQLICVAGAALPADGLDEVSGGVLSTEFDDVFAAPAKGIAIPDNTGIEAVSQITVPDIGIAKDLIVTVDVSNSDLSTLSILLLPPDDKVTGILLCDPCGDVDAKSYKVKLPTPTKPAKGDFSKYLGKSPQGLWTLKIKDTSFCVPQKPGNAALCDLTQHTDGKLVDWSLTVHTLSKSKAQVIGDLVVKGGISSQNGLLIGGASAACDASLFGRMRMDDPGGLEMCNGVDWVAALPRPAYWQGGCKTNGSTDWRYFCTSHTDYNSAQRYLDVADANSGSSTDAATGKITVKIAGAYRVAFTSWGVSAQRYWELHLNGKAVAEGRNYNAGSSNNALSFDRVLWLEKGDVLNLRLYASDGTSWYGATSSAGKQTLARSTWLRVTYAGHNWKAKLVCGDGEVDAGEQCDDGNDKDDDLCGNDCKSNIPPMQVWSEVATSAQTPSLNMGTIAGIPGKQLVIYKIGICGDSEQTSGSNQFQISGGGLTFTWHAGQNDPGSTYTLTPAPAKGASRGLTVKEVNHVAQVGASVTVSWTYHNDWDGHRCTDTDEFGNVYDDQTGSSVRSWVVYGYK